MKTNGDAGKHLNTKSCLAFNLGGDEGFGGGEGEHKDLLIICPSTVGF